MGIVFFDGLDKEFKTCKAYQMMTNIKIKILINPSILVSLSSDIRNFFVKKKVLNYATFIHKRQRSHLQFTCHTRKEIYYSDYCDFPKSGNTLTEVE